MLFFEFFRKFNLTASSKALVHCFKIDEDLQKMKDVPFDDIKKLAIENNIDFHKLLGNFYLKNQDYEDAISNFEIYISNNPNDATVLGILGYLYDMLYAKTQNNSYIEKALEYTQNAYFFDKNNPNILENLILMYKDTGFIDKAFELWPEFLREKTPDDKIYYDYALINLKKANFQEYYKYAAHRLNFSIANHFYPKFNKPMWNGENISDSILLVHFEQGFGDTIMFSRYLKNLSKKAKKVIFVVQKELEELFKYNNFDCEICSDISKVKNFDYHIPLISLMQISNVDANNLIYTDKYLNTDKNIVSQFKNEYFNSDKFKIAVKYQGDNLGPVNRNISSEKFFKIFENIKNTEIYSLQFNEESKEDKNLNIIHLKNNVKNFYETAAVIENMDLVITTDNVILHLAGALGKKTLGLYNFASESRWFDLKGDDVKWYKSVKPFVADNLNDWDNVISKVNNYIESNTRL